MTGLAAEADVTQPPFAAGMFPGRPADREAFPRKNAPRAFLHLDAIRQHDVTLERADVVQVNIHRQPGVAAQKQVEGGASLERPLVLHARMGRHRVQKVEKHESLFQHFGTEPGLTDGGRDRRLRELQGMSSQARFRISSGTIRFQSATSRLRPGAPRAR